MLREAIEKIEKSIKYPVVEIEYEAEYYDVTFDYIEKKHLFYLPKGADAPEIVYMRNLCHAYLAEHVDPLFSSVVVQYDDSLPDRVFENVVWPVFCVSRMWFADGLMYKLCKKETREWVEEKVKLVKRAFSGEKFDASVKDTLELSLILAEGEAFGDKKLDTKGKIGELVEIFLSVDPQMAELKHLERLNNALLETTSGFSVELLDNNDLGGRVWRCFKK